mgnify:CR=1 FL=1
MDNSIRYIYKLHAFIYHDLNISHFINYHSKHSITLFDSTNFEYFTDNITLE